MTESKKLPRGRLERLLNRKAQAVLHTLGFRDEDDGCLREFEGGAQYVAIAVSDIGARNSVAPFGQTGCLAPHRVLERYLGPRRMYGLGQFQVEYGYFTGDHIHGRPCQTEHDLVETDAWLEHFLVTELVPCLEMHSHPNAILQAYIAHDETKKYGSDALSWGGWSSAATGLVYARIYGPEHYPALRQRYARIFEPLLPEYRAQATALLAYLDRDRIDEDA